ncbi:diguanylate cyclase [Bradyrhizobium sp. CCBAU 65884]|uniref:diguanylate cyclase n=1 Tax=Bradyrhizobium sp. CCBAU 65884 TaxID=722477 RepID=UPI002306133D|nr:diguanylate cyclase [Bradyrhizobium sp. CCBAU 65884]MDA9478878.1 diguanylate cyclase [Bradyrhizobium sp. CCBAU 65884]
MPISASPRRPTVLISAFVALTVGCVLGLVAWKSISSRDATLSRNEADIQNLAHSLAQHATHTFKAPDVAMTGMADLLKFQNPLPARFNTYLANTVRSLPQLREMGVLNAAGNWRYSSLDQLPTHNNADRDYFVRHRDNADPKLLISGPMTSRLTGRPTLLLSKRISDPKGEFAGVLVAAIDYESFSKFYSSFDIGAQGSICLISATGTILVRWPSGTGKNVSDTDLFQKRLKASPVGFYRIVSPFDGVAKYFGYEVTPEYSMVVTVARSEAEVLHGWRSDLKRDLVVAALLMTVIAGMAWLLASQFGVRMRLARRYRLLAENSADIVILLDRQGRLQYVSQSVKASLGYAEKELVGRSCLDVVHAEDREKVVGASVGLTDPAVSRSVVFRTKCKDGKLVWLEANFKLAGESPDGSREIVGVLRDITKRKELEDELSEANLRLSRLATTDGLTRLANRRHFDIFMRAAYAEHAVLAALLIDIDHFKGFNDALGHQAGDACLQRIAQVIDSSTTGTSGLSARYGGEEFAVVLPGVSEEQALVVANALRLMVRQLGIQHPRASRGHVTVSIGVAAKTATTIDEVALIRDADIALYNAKELGRNCAVASSSLSGTHGKAAPLVPAS